jgi:hypothetical protein
LARYQHFHAGGLNLVDMHENIGAAVIGQDEAKSAICVEEFDPSGWHFWLPIHPLRRASMDIMSFISPQIIVLVLVTVVLMITVLALVALPRCRSWRAF